MRRPTDSSVITLRYGATSAPYSAYNPHAGVDYRAPTGANIYAPHSGKVTIAGSQGACGLAVDINGSRFKSRLCHNSKLLVAVGNEVFEGQVVAKAGATGQASGSHCHWVLWDNGNRVDGSKYVSEGEDVYQGKTAQQWAKDYEGQKKAADERYAFVAGTGKRLGELLERPAVDDIPAANFYVDEAIKGWRFRQNIINELQAKVKELQEKGDVTQEEIDDLAKKADELEKSIKGVNK